MASADRITHISCKPNLRSNLSDVVATVDVGLQMARRNLLVVYKQTFFGVAWALVRPIALTVVFAALYRSSSGGRSVGFGLALLAGVLPMQFFVQCTTSVADSLFGNRGLIAKVYFPRIWVVLAAATQAVVDLLVSLPLLFLALAIWGPGLNARLLLMPFLVAACVFATVGFGTLCAVAVVRLRDIRHALPFVLQLLYFVGPVAYDASSLPRSIQLLIYALPASGMVEAFRWASLPERGLDVEGVLVSAATALILFVLGFVSLLRSQGTLADRV